MIITLGKDAARNTRKYFTSDTSPFCYIPIHKNAHLFGLKYFKVLADFEEVRQVSDEKRYVIFLRDPVKRWYSAAAQYFSMNIDNDGKFIYNEKQNSSRDDTNRALYTIDPLTMKLVFDAVRLDYHGDLQLNYLLGLNTYKCVFFNTDDPDFEFKLNHFAKYQLKVKIPESKFKSQLNIQKFNVSEHNKFKMNIQQQLLDAVKQNPSFINNVYSYYRADSEFVKSVRYYAPWIRK